MDRKIKIIDINYHHHNEYDDPADVISKHRPANGFAEQLDDKYEVILVKHLNYEGERIQGKIKYQFFKSNNKFWHIPSRSHRFIKKEKPDIVLIQGFIFPLQLIMLRRTLGKKVKFIAQHHGEKPFTGIKKILQRIADRYIDAYTFTANGNADEWIEQKIISSAGKCFEILEASTDLIPIDKKQARVITGMEADKTFLWVGRLEKNKDPLTVLDGFEKYLCVYPHAKLYMIYQEDGLLLEVKKKIVESSLLKGSVFLKGKIAHEELNVWFSAADFYIAGSHKEAAGYTLLEAMVCGCIPVVTNIPPSRKITAEGKLGFLFKPGNSVSLLEMLNATSFIEKEKISKAVQEHFKKNLSFKAIAGSMSELFEKLLHK